MITDHTFEETTQLSKEEISKLIFVETIYAVNNGSDYAADTFTEEEEAEEYSKEIEEKMGNECTVVEVDVYQTEEEEFIYLHKD